MANMNRQLKLPQIQKIMMEFEKQVRDKTYCIECKKTLLYRQTSLQRDPFLISDSSLGPLENKVCKILFRKHGMPL